LFRCCAVRLRNDAWLQGGYIMQQGYVPFGQDARCAQYRISIVIYHRGEYRPQDQYYDIGTEYSCFEV
jgi:hypothetical protein